MRQHFTQKASSAMLVFPVLGTPYFESGNKIFKASDPDHMNWVYNCYVKNLPASQKSVRREICEQHSFNGVSLAEGVFSGLSPVPMKGV
jgi:hypothetical protein